jgi:hypothetical protein
VSDGPSGHLELLVIAVVGGCAWRIRFTKNSSSKPDTQMEEVTIQLLSADEKSATKSFFCMYLIRPRVSPMVTAFAPAINQLEGCFKRLEAEPVYRMGSKFFEKQKIFSCVREATPTVSELTHHMYVTVAVNLPCSYNQFI